MGSEPAATESSITAEAEAEHDDETIIDQDVILEAKHLAKKIHKHADILLQRLLSHLTQFPEFPAVTPEDDASEHETIEDDNDDDTLMLKRGLTIPVSAVAWLSDQLEILERLQNHQTTPELELAMETADDENDKDQQQQQQEDATEDQTQSTSDGQSPCCDLEPWVGTESITALRYRLNLLRFLLPRAQLIRLTRQSWPPRSSSSTSGVPSMMCSSPKQRLKQWWKKRQRPSNSYDATTEARATNFLRYARRFKHGAPDCVDLWRVFPNASVLILENLPPSWINLKGHAIEPPTVRSQKLPGLRLLSASNAAIYDFDFFPTVPTSLQSPVSESLTHLKLDNCSLGELTTGFSSSLAQLVHLEYLSLRQNQFRSAKTLLKGLRPLTKLRYLDVSANQLVGCFGPYANLCLGGQVRILKLSDNLLETCRNSGLEKCYGLQEIWLDSNNIQDVVEVSGLARLPDLQCLALQRNPFSQRNRKTSLLSSSFTRTSEETITEPTSSYYDNPFFDPLWKIRLWTWFQHERHALTPLELPLLNKKTKNLGHGRNGCDASMMGRMTKEEWDRIQEESFSVAASVATCTTMTTTTTRTIASSIATEESHTAAASSFQEVPVPTRLVEPVRNRRVTKKSKTRRAKIHNGDHKNFTDQNNGQKRRPKKDKKKSSSQLVTKENSRVMKKAFLVDSLSIHELSFSLQDVLVSIHNEDLQQYRPTESESEAPTEVLEKIENNEFEKGNVEIEPVDSEPPTTKETSDKCAVENNAPSNPFLEDDGSPVEATGKNDESKDGEEEEIKEDCEQETPIQKTETCGDTNGPKTSEPIPPQNDQAAKENTDVSKEETDKSDDNEEVKHSKASESPSKKKNTKTSSTSTPKRSPKRSPRRTPRRPEVIDEDRIFVRPKVTSIKLSRMGKHKPFDALSSDWDDVIKKASEGRIPDGLLKSPVDEATNDIGMNEVIFSDQAADLLGSAESKNPGMAKSADQMSESRSTKDPTVDPSLSSNNRISNSLPEHIWQDDDSVLSSLGASRDDIPKRVNKFQLAEENCSYDGPDSSRGMKVVENLQLYFESFVFPTSMPDLPELPEDVLEEMEEDQGDWQLVTMYHPRIQLWPDDRKLVELERIRISSSMHRADWTTNRERFLRVWEEDLIPCGKPAMRRLPPNRKHRLGFHGDKLFENAEVDAYAECRKVLLCLSSKAFYVILEKDDVTMRHKKQSNKRTFPLPLDAGDRFRDAPWPHAVARHGLEQLEAICIGFEFQRLTLRFRNTSLPKSDPFVYVLLTGDKRASVRIFQEIQKLAKDLADNNGGSNLKKNSSNIEIENDSHVVLDSLNSLSDLQGQSIGTIMHFQIVQQQWKHGDRGTVRRACVITDTRILLLDEDYAADGHDISSVTVKGKNMADVRYRMVDQAELSLVSQVQAANADPRAITIIINPSTLSRTKRWRLVCRDREGAERLVEDARKALEDR